MADPAADPRLAELTAQAFHEAYERLAPSFGYETREASAVPWSEVPEPNRSLMIAVAGEVLALLPARTATTEARVNDDPFSIWRGECGHVWDRAMEDVDECPRCRGLSNGHLISRAVGPVGRRFVHEGDPEWHEQTGDCGLDHVHQRARRVIVYAATTEAEACRCVGCGGDVSPIAHACAACQTAALTATTEAVALAAAIPERLAEAMHVHFGCVSSPTEDVARACWRKDADAIAAALAATGGER